VKADLVGGYESGKIIPDQQVINKLKSVLNQIKPTNPITCVMRAARSSVYRCVMSCSVALRYVVLCNESGKIFLINDQQVINKLKSVNP
jgi:hypothetical protein